MIGIGSDHGGFQLKEELKAHLESRGFEVKDFGAYDESSCDYADIAEPVARAVASGECERAILVCGTGIGMCMAANKVKGIRAAVCSDCFSAKLTREHNDCNVLCLGGRVVG
ncbi:MAG: ribose 5-phosphate isomerase B, partial [Eubacterium sp.]|nr:ribose 5-phosphate isomerase B [Eubacterium sp.]